MDVTGKDVYLVDDIYDSGNTMNRLIKNISYGNPKSITPVTLFKRHTAKNDDLIYGFNLENESLKANNNLFITNPSNILFFCSGFSLSTL